ncbi:MAG: hypothetical protein OXI44_06455 [Bacteroidota bacterium]|nr:hypothetical protein [Bacteroidota bacterium]
MGPLLHKKRRGQYYTESNPFRHSAFVKWAKDSGMQACTVLEPFAGSNSIIKHLRVMDLCRSFRSYDIEPASKDVEYRDTLANFPQGFEVCVTNPPWLARNIATFKGLEFPEGEYGNLYQYALENCLSNCDWVAALVPESFIRTQTFRKRLSSFVSVTECLFTDTGHPVGMALFQPTKTEKTRVWVGKQLVGCLEELEKDYPIPRKNGVKVVFNAPNGNVGLYALDNTVQPSIRFCSPDELSDYAVKRTGRHITKLWVDGKIELEKWNAFLNEFRHKTHDVLMTCYKGIRKDGKYRRRLDWQLARGIIHNA